MTEQAAAARRLMLHQDVGMLSTISADVEGYPFGSIVPFIFDYDGYPVILISDLAQHTRNIKRDKRVSLTVFDRFAQDAQAGGRLTWIGDAEPLSSDEEIRPRYLRYFPSSESYFATHDFSFYRIGLKRARFIGGFGEIYWIEPTSMVISNPFRKTERGIVNHMNKDHTNALFHYVGMDQGAEVSSVTMTGLDAEGFDLLADGRKVRIDFEAPIQTVEEARAELVRLARS